MTRERNPRPNGWPLEPTGVNSMPRRRVPEGDVNEGSTEYHAKFMAPRPSSGELEVEAHEGAAMQRAVLHRAVRRLLKSSRTRPAPSRREGLGRGAPSGAFDRYFFLFIRIYIPFSPVFTILSSFAMNAYPRLRTARFFFSWEEEPGANKFAARTPIRPSPRRGVSRRIQQAAEPRGRGSRSGDTTRERSTTRNTRCYRARTRTSRPLTPYRPSTRVRNMGRAELDASTPRRRK